MEGTLVALLGPDGAGKSTLLNTLRGLRPGWKYISATPTDLYPLPGLPCYDWALQTHPRHVVPHMRPYTRAAFYATTLAVEYEYHIAPALKAGETVICDSYWYRFAAKEALQNPAADAPLRALTALLPAPDLALRLNVPHAVAWQRKGGELTQFEVDGEVSFESYVRFQDEVLRTVDEYLEDVDKGDLDGTKPVHDVATKTVRLVERLQARQSRAVG